MLALVPAALLLLWAYRAPRAIGRRGVLVLSLAFALLILVSGQDELMYRAVWNAARNLFPVLAVSGVVLLSRERAADRRSPLLRERTLLLLSVAALCSLVQFPFSVPNYFCYVAPLVFLSALALYSYLPPLPAAGTMSALMVAFFTAFAVLRTNGSPLQSMGIGYQPQFPMTRLALERGGIEIPRVHASAYQELIPLLREHARGGHTWASPDTPEIYFLSGLRNPTRSLFEFFEDSANAEGRVLAALDARGVTAIVLNSRPSFSPAISRPMFVQLATRYPHARNIGPFQLRWRE
jgi:hypothetical protein